MGLGTWAWAWAQDPGPKTVYTLPMQKLLAGCLVIVVLGTVAVVVALYFGYRAAQPLIDNATG